jgi:two-component system, NtrC family, nitrogen regulation response regulator NtrX
MALDILIVDDERDIRDLVAGVLSDEGYECRTAGDSTTALAMIDERRPSLVLLDVWLHGSPMDGLEVLDAIKAREPELPVIIFSGHGNIDTAVSAVSRGAMDFIEKPFEASACCCWSNGRPRPSACGARTPGCAKDSPRQRPNSPAIQHHQPGPRDPQARGQHRQPGADFRPGGIGQGSRRPPAPRVEPAGRQAPSSRSIPPASRPERFEQELFGEEADGKLVRPACWKWPMAARSISTKWPTCRFRTQARILRVLTDQSFVRVGGTARSASMCAWFPRRRATWKPRSPKSASARTCSTASTWCRSRSPRWPSGATTFRRWPSISLPATPANRGLPRPEISPEAMAALQAYDWPGNVRQLRNVVERTSSCPARKLERIEPDMLPPEIVGGGTD